MNDNHSSDTGKEKDSVNNLILVPEKVAPGSLADLMAQVGIEMQPRHEHRSITEVHIHKTILYADGYILIPVNDYITLDFSNNKLIIRNFQGTHYSRPLMPVMMKLLQALLSSSQKKITKAETEEKGQQWSTYMSKYREINKISHCDLITIAGGNSLKLDLAVIPIFLSKRRKF